MVFQALQRAYLQISANTPIAAKVNQHTFSTKKCDFMQGYLLSKTIDANAFSELLKMQSTG